MQIKSNKISLTYNTACIFHQIKKETTVMSPVQCITPQGYSILEADKLNLESKKKNLFFPNDSKLARDRERRNWHFLALNSIEFKSHSRTWLRKASRPWPGSRLRLTQNRWTEAGGGSKDKTAAGDNKDDLPESSWV